MQCKSAVGKYVLWKLQSFITHTQATPSYTKPRTACLMQGGSHDIRITGHGGVKERNRNSGHGPIGQPVLCSIYM